MNTIEEVKAEIEQLKKEHQKQPVCEDDEKYVSILEGFLNTCWGEYFLLHEKEDFQNWIENRLKPACKEQPVCEGLDEEISNYIEKHFGESWDGCVPVGCFELDKMAHHFAQWGAEHLKK